MVFWSLSQAISLCYTSISMYFIIWRIKTKQLLSAHACASLFMTTCCLFTVNTSNCFDSFLFKSDCASLRGSIDHRKTVNPLCLPSSLLLLSMLFWRKKGPGKQSKAIQSSLLSWNTKLIAIKTLEKEIINCCGYQDSRCQAGVLLSACNLFIFFLIWFCCLLFFLHSLSSKSSSAMCSKVTKMERVFFKLNHESKTKS